MRKVFYAFVLINLTWSAFYGQNREMPGAQHYFEEGVRLLREKSYDQALASFESSAMLDATKPATFANIGMVSIFLKRFDKAETAYRAAIKLSPGVGVFHSELCRALSLQKKHTAALETCEDGVRLSPTAESTHAARLFAMKAAGRVGSEMQRLIDVAVGQFRSSEMILATAADFYLANGNFTYAASLLESLVGIRPEIPQYHGMLAEAYLRLGRDAESLASTRTALRLEPENPYGNYCMGLIFFELGQHEEAAESFGKVRSDDPRLRMAQYYLALSDAKRGKVTAAIDRLRELAEQYPERVELHFALGVNLQNAYRFAEMEAAYLRAKQLKPDHPDAFGGLALSYMLQAKYDKAVPLYEEMIRLWPSNEQNKMFLNVARGRQIFVPRIPDMIREAEANPQNFRIRYDLVRALAYANRIQEADKYLAELYALDPNEDQMYVGLGGRLVEAGKPDKAIEAYRKSLVKKENPGAYLGIASIHADRGEFELASAAYAKVIELKPDTPNIMKNYADLLRDYGKRREALEMYKRSLALLPSNGSALFHAAVLSLKLGDRETATNYLGVLQTVDPQLAKQLSRCVALRIWG